MQLTITALGNKSTPFIAEILSMASSCECNVLELKSSNITQTTAAFIAVDGHWNQIAKLETLLDNLQKRIEINIHTLRPDSNYKKQKGIPYSLETISINNPSVLEDITSFLFEHKICIESINATNFQAPYIQSPIFSTKFILIIPPDVRLLALREEFLDFCDNINIDAIIEPIKQ